MAAERVFGKSQYDLTIPPKRFQFVGDYLEFSPSEWSENGWEVMAREQPSKVHVLKLAKI